MVLSSLTGDFVGVVGKKLKGINTPLSNFIFSFVKFELLKDEAVRSKGIVEFGQNPAATELAESEIVRLRRVTSRDPGPIVEVSDIFEMEEL